jgi:hypothetical protein
MWFEFNSCCHEALFSINIWWCYKTSPHHILKSLGWNSIGAFVTWCTRKFNSFFPFVSTLTLPVFSFRQPHWHFRLYIFFGNVVKCVFVESCIRHCSDLYMWKLKFILSFVSFYEIIYISWMHLLLNTYQIKRWILCENTCTNYTWVLSPIILWQLKKKLLFKLHISLPTSIMVLFDWTVSILFSGNLLIWNYIQYCVAKFLIPFLDVILH